MTTKTITPIVTINKSQLKDDVNEILTSNGFSITEYERFVKQQEYRKSYSQRSYVVEKRKDYMKKRYERMKELRALLQS